MRNSHIYSSLTLHITWETSSLNEEQPKQFLSACWIISISAVFTFSPGALLSSSVVAMLLQFVLFFFPSFFVLSSVLSINAILIGAEYCSSRASVQIPLLSERCLIWLYFHDGSSSLNLKNFQFFVVVHSTSYAVGYHAEATTVGNCRIPSNTNSWLFGRFWKVLESFGIVYKSPFVAMWHFFSREMSVRGVQYAHRSKTQLTLILSKWVSQKVMLLEYLVVLFNYWDLNFICQKSIKFLKIPLVRH